MFSHGALLRINGFVHRFVYRVYKCTVVSI